MKVFVVIFNYVEVKNENIEMESTEKGFSTFEKAKEYFAEVRNHEFESIEELKEDGFNVEYKVVFDNETYFEIRYENAFANVYIEEIEID